MTVALNDPVHLFSVEKLKNDNKNELFFNYNYTPKPVSQEFIAAPSLCKTKRTTFQAAMKLTILIGQCFALNPVLGVCEVDTSKVRFTFLSAKCFYSILSIMGQSVLVCFCILTLFGTSGSSLESSSSLVFYGTNFLTTIMFFRVAMKWPRLCQQISRSEAADPNTDNALVKRCNISCILVLSLALLEHLLADVSGIAVAIDCMPDNSLYEAFILTSVPWIWKYVTYNPIFGALSQFLNIQCTFNWNFADAFVICISWYLISRLEQVNHRVNAVRGKFAPASFWRLMREDYTRVTNLIRKVDKVVSGIIFLSFANNLFFICWQMLHTFEEGFKATSLCHRNAYDRPLRGYEQAVYHAYSFTFLIARSLAVSLVAARVHTASRQPAQALYDVPSTAYCAEVQRFINQIHGDPVALSGLQFFNVKRGLVLTIAGTIVTYELVLMQFAGVTPTTATPLAPVTLTLPSGIPS